MSLWQIVLLSGAGGSAATIAIEFVVLFAILRRNRIIFPPKQKRSNRWWRS